MRTLIFGGTGMLGQALTGLIRRRGGSVLALSRSQADILDGESVLAFAREFRPSLIINCAALTAVDDCEGNRAQAMAINGEAVGNVVECARLADAELIHLSSDYVFAGDGTRPYREGDPVAPVSVYGESKVLGEERASRYQRSLIVRTSWVFGTGGRNFVRSIVGAIEGGKRHLRVVSDQLGCPTYAPFLARAIWDLAAAQARGLVHYRNREPVSWYEFAREIAGLVDREVVVEAIPTSGYPLPAQRPAYSVLDVERFETIMNRRVESWGWGLDHYLQSTEVWRQQ